MPHGIPRGAMCVQRFDDSLNSAIHTTYRISLRSSSMPEPRDPLLKVVIIIIFQTLTANTMGGLISRRGRKALLGKQTVRKKAWVTSNRWESIEIETRQLR